MSLEVLLHLLLMSCLILLHVLSNLGLTGILFSEFLFLTFSSHITITLGLVDHLHSINHNFTDLLDTLMVGVEFWLDSFVDGSDFKGCNAVLVKHLMLHCPLHQIHLTFIHSLQACFKRLYVDTEMNHVVLTFSRVHVITLQKLEVFQCGNLEVNRHPFLSGLACITLGFLSAHKLHKVIILKISTTNGIPCGIHFLHLIH